MRSTVPCPVCMHTLTFIVTPPALGCPFCRASIDFANGRIPVGEKVRCRRCGGVFTAEALPPEIRVFASVPEPCPACQTMLAVRKDLPPGKKVKCRQCGTKFYPSRHVEAKLAPPNEPGIDPVVTPPEPIPPVVKPVSKTRLGPRQGAPRSSITHLALDPLEEIPQHVPAPEPPVRSLGEDEIDLLGTDLGVDLEIPQEQTAPLDRVASPVKPDSDRGGPSVDQAEAAPVAPAVRQHPPANPKPPHRADAHSENGAAVPADDLRVKPAPAGKRKKRRLAVLAAKAKQCVPALLEVEPGDVEVMDEGPIGGPSETQAEIQRSDAPKPLSYQSAEREAASALLDDAPEEPEEQETGPPIRQEDRPLTATQPARRPLAAVAAPTIPRTPTQTGEPSITIDGKKVLTYAVPVLILAALAFGIYYLFIGRGPGRLRVYKTEGIVLFQGKPAAGARVMLFPSDLNKRHRYCPTGKVGDDGKFRLTTYESDDGAPAGRYKVTVARGQMDMKEYEELSKTKTPEEIRRICEDREARDPLYSKYAEVRDTALIAEITAGKDNQLEYKLD